MTAYRIFTRSGAPQGIGRILSIDPHEQRVLDELRRRREARQTMAARQDALHG